MSAADNTPPNSKDAEKAMTAAQAAKQVRRTVTELATDKEGKPVKEADGTPKVVVKQVAVAADEVLSFKDYGTHVVVVTKDGQKFSSAEA